MDAAGRDRGGSELAFGTLCRVARHALEADAAVIWVRGTGSWRDVIPGADPAGWAAEPDRDLPEKDAPATGNGVDWIEDLRLARDEGIARTFRGAAAARFAAAVRFGDDGEGGLIVLGGAPRSRTEDGERQLRDLAAVAAQLLAERRARDRAEAGERAFRLLAETTTDTIVRGNLDGIRLYISPAVRDLLGYEPEELVGRRAIDIVHPDDVARFADLMRQIREGRMEVGVCEIRQRHRDGSWVWMEASVRHTFDARTGEADGYVASVRGIGRRKELEQRLARLASFDDLTGLPNRAMFREQLFASIERSQSIGTPFAVLYLDLDRLKLVNDMHGHAAGDAMLREAAVRFQSALRQEDFVARIGGDEFAAIVPGGREVGERIALRLVEAAMAPLHVRGAALGFGVSIGVACIPEHGLDPDRVLAAADLALYRAKTEGRNLVRVFEPTPAAG